MLGLRFCQKLSDLLEFRRVATENTHFKKYATLDTTLLTVKPFISYIPILAVVTD